MALRSTSPLGFVRRALCAGIAASFGATVVAQPVGLTAVHGAASMGREGSVTTVTTTNGAGGRSVLNWTSFGVPTGDTVHFQQPDAVSTSINRVLGGNPSSIFGTLSSNGRLVLVNPAGITVGAGAVVDTAGFTASALGLSQENAIAGRLLFGTGELGDFKRKDGGVQVQGKTQVNAAGGDVVLIGHSIDIATGALVQATGGDVVLAAGRTVEVTGRGLEGIVMQVRAPDDRAVNLGTLRGDSVAIFAGHLHHSGLVQARSATSVGGKVVLQATDEGEIDGRILATTAASGGSVRVTADKLRLQSDTVIDVSHANGGGEILVGGGLHGRDARVPNARDVEIDDGVRLRAEATLSGNGGTVVAWSDDEMEFRGRILARGAGGGVGGLVEVSARDRVKFQGSVTVRGDGASGGAAPDNNAGSGSGRGGNPGPGSDSSGRGSGDSAGPRSPDDSGRGNNSGPGRDGAGNGDSSGSGRGSNGGTDTAGNGGSSSGPSNSGSSGSAGGPGPSGGPIPIVPIVGQITEVRSASERTQDDTAHYLAKGSTLLDPGQDDFASLQPAATSRDTDARVLGAGPDDRRGKRRKGEVVLTDAQCRAGS